VGRFLGILSFRPPGQLSALADTPQGFVAIAATLLAYGAAELLGGYGFLAVFVAAVALRSSERGHEFHEHLHTFTNQTENLLVVGLLVMFGGALAGGILGGLTWAGALVAVLVVGVARPLSGHLALIGTSLTPEERWTIAFFGIRGFGTVYYLAYALNHATFEDSDALWAIVSLTLVLSIAAHGVTATPAMALVDRARKRSGRRRRPARR
jgi:NhaP-type Na+/H+ or K+/H+ antiporter